jgi:hypothetical protein
MGTAQDAPLGAQTYTVNGQIIPTRYMDNFILPSA